MCIGMEQKKCSKERYKECIYFKKIWLDTKVTYTVMIFQTQYEAPFSKYKASMLKGAMPKRKFLLSDRFSTPL